MESKEVVHVPRVATLVEVATQVEQVYQLADGNVVREKELLLLIYNSLEEIKRKLK